MKYNLHYKMSMNGIGREWAVCMAHSLQKIQNIAQSICVRGGAGLQLSLLIHRGQKFFQFENFFCGKVQEHHSDAELPQLGAGLPQLRAVPLEVTKDATLVAAGVAADSVQIHRTSSTSKSDAGRGGTVSGGLGLRVVGLLAACRLLSFALPHHQQQQPSPIQGLLLLSLPPKPSHHQQAGAIRHISSRHCAAAVDGIDKLCLDFAFDELDLLVVQYYLHIVQQHIKDGEKLIDSLCCRCRWC
jgi:hypothetical protein